MVELRPWRRRRISATRCENPRARRGDAFHRAARRRAVQQRGATSEMLESAKGKMDGVVYRRARHVIGENERTVHCAEGVRNSNWPTVGQLMFASHASLRDDYEVSCKELDVIVEIAGNIGVK